MWGHHTQRQCPKWQNPLAKNIILEDLGKKLHFSVKENL